MRRVRLQQKAGPVSEMAIVDTFTKLIFGEDDQFSAGELTIIEALRLVDDNVSTDGYCEMGNYLRALGVGEMIKLVSMVRAQLSDGVPSIPVPSVAPDRPRHA